MFIKFKSSFVQKSFFLGKSRNWPKSRTNDVMHTKFNCKAEEINEIEVVNSKKTGCKNHRWRRRIKKHSRTSPDVQFKEISMIKQKNRPRTDYEGIGNSFVTIEETAKILLTKNDFKNN